MLELFSKYFKKDFPEQEKYTFYLAISGGKDSMVLSHLLIQAGIDHKLLHCNFNLRSAESDQDQKFVENHSVEHGLELKIKSFDTTKESEKRNINIQLTARDLRYEWFNTILDLDEHKKSILLTAHHLDDSIETFFINLLRGTGLKGLSGIPKRNGSTYRPLLDFALSDILTFVDSHKIDYRQDSSNNENKYLRNKIRHSLIPLVEQLSPEIRKKFKALFKESIEHQTFLEVEKVNFKLEQVIQNKNYSSISKNLFKDDLNVVTKEFLKDLDIRRSNINEFVKFSKSING
ncbi:MAG: tRNA(Ile)-lysidine synthase, partial [Arenicella sp.]